MLERGVKQFVGNDKPPFLLGKLLLWIDIDFRQAGSCLQTIAVPVPPDVWQDAEKRSHPDLARSYV